jgi:integrase
MPRPKNLVPSYSFHRPTGQAYVRLANGVGRRKTVYLGVYNSPESRAEYARLITDLQSSPHRVEAIEPGASVSNLTLNEVFLAFVLHAERYYRRPDGSETREVGEFKQVSRIVREMFGHTPAIEFGPLALKAVRARFLAAGWCRVLVNRRVNRVRHVLKWAAGEELVPGTVWQNLRSVSGLKAGRSEAPERAPVAPVADEVVEATIPFLSSTVATMVKVQRLTGMRPGEICLLRPVDIDMSGHVWTYRPPYHKLAYRGSQRVVVIGPRAQAFLKLFTPAQADDYFFSPRRAVIAHHAARGVARVTPYSRVRGHRIGEARSNAKFRLIGNCYTNLSFGRAVARGIVRANRERTRHQAAFGPNLPLLPHWHPNQLRHTHATTVRRRYGLEAAQVSLGHTKANITEVYAERDLALAVEVAGDLG